MATFALYISLFCTPLETLVNSAETYQKAIAGFKRMDEVLSTVPDIQDKSGAADLQVTAGAVEYRDVCFSYEDVELGERGADGRPVIDHMDLSIKPGQTIALVGPRAAANRRLVRCCRAFTTLPPAPLASTARMCAT